MVKKIILTRPQDRNEDFMVRFAFDFPDMKPEFLSAPATSIRPLFPSVPLPENVDALVITSVNALHLFKNKIPAYKNIKVYVVGHYTAQVARNVGFSGEMTCRETACILADVIRAEKPDRLLYIRGTDIAFDFFAYLSPYGIQVESCIAYCADPVDMLPVCVNTFIMEQGEKAVMFFSQRSAKIFIDLLRKDKKKPIIESVTPLCIGAAVLECVQPFFKDRAYAARSPDMRGMLDLVAAYTMDNL